MDCGGFSVLWQLHHLNEHRGGSRIPLSGGANLPGKGYQHTNLPDFPEKCMKLRKFWSVGGGEGEGGGGSATGTFALNPRPPFCSN